MLWPAIVASGVAILSMTVFASWITRRRRAGAEAAEFSQVADPDDPWAAYRPRPFDHETVRTRPRLWPVAAGLTGLILVGGGIAGARQNARLEAVSAEPTSQPYVVQYDSTALPVATAAATAEPTAEPIPVVPAATTKPAPAPSASAAGPTITGTASCAGSQLSGSFTISGSHLSWFAIYLDKALVKGGSMTGGTYTASLQRSVAAGDHDLEVSADDKAGHHARKFVPIHCK